jgi:hypothetical protein
MAVGQVVMLNNTVLDGGWHVTSGNAQVDYIE